MTLRQSLHGYHQQLVRKRNCWGWGFPGGPNAAATSTGHWSRQDRAGRKLVTTSHQPVFCLVDEGWKRQYQRISRSYYKLLPRAHKKWYAAGTMTALVQYGPGPTFLSACYLAVVGTRDLLLSNAAPFALTAGNGNVQCLLQPGFGIRPMFSKIGGQNPNKQGKLYLRVYNIVKVHNQGVSECH